IIKEAPKILHGQLQKEEKYAVGTLRKSASSLGIIGCQDLGYGYNGKAPTLSCTSSN
ncbi:hypothetical protein V5O48_011600, partial [Marasmius crinis-equi]